MSISGIIVRRISETCLIGAGIMPRKAKKSAAKARKTTKTAKRVASAKRAPRKPPARRVLVLVATRKGAWLYRGDASRKSWQTDGPHFLGHIVNHLVLDPRDGETLLCAVRAGHLGPTVFRSTDFGRTWKEAQRPPAFPKATPGEKGLAVEHVFWLTPGHSSEPGAWYAGVSPPGLFRS